MRKNKTLAERKKAAETPTQMITGSKHYAQSLEELNQRINDRQEQKEVNEQYQRAIEQGNNVPWLLIGLFLVTCISFGVYWLK